MIAKITADIVVFLHLAFIVFVAVGGLFVLRWPKLAWAHVPCFIWGVLIELTGWICPLTPLENRLRIAAGDHAYGGDFIDRYILPIIYPAGLTRSLQLVLAAMVVVANLVIYGLSVHRLKRRRPHED